MKRFLIFCLSWLCLSTAIAKKQEVNIYNWSGYLPDSVKLQFEKETGVHVNYSTYDSNETLYAKLKANPTAEYDIIMPSTYYIDRMRHENMLKVIDRKKIVGFNHLNPSLLNQPYDPHNFYSVPYFWGTSAIVINTRYHSLKSVTKWADLLDKKYKDQLMLLDDVREVFSMALITLGYSPNTTKEEEIQKAYFKLHELLPNVRLFTSDADEAIYIDEDATIGMGWSGDIYQASLENPDVNYIYPKEGYIIWVDNIAIPKGSKNTDNAYKFINFILRPEIAREICLKTGYATPNLAAIKLMPKKVRDNPIINPPESVIKKGKFQTDVGTANIIYEKYWELLKITG